VYQFIHIDVFALKVSSKAIARREQKKGGGTRSLLNVRQVIAEAGREAGACPHVPVPQPPTKLFGCDLAEVEAMAIASTEGQEDSKGRKLRSDTPILLAGVVSYPREQYERNPEAFEAWLADTIQWLKDEFGDCLKNVTLHLDEPHPHIHFYAVSPDGRAKSLHAGYEAERQSGATDSKVKKSAYQQGMREFQDRYYLDVGSAHGLLRIGPGRQRKSRAAYQAEKAHAGMLAEKIRQVDDMERAATAGIDQIYGEMLARAAAEIALKDEASMGEAKVRAQRLMDIAKQEVEKLLAAARAEARRVRDEVLQWSRHTVENMQRLAASEKRVGKLERELADTKEELEVFVEENRDLRQRLARGARNDY
jgi:hypothetical protein